MDGITLETVCTEVHITSSSMTVIASGSEESQTSISPAQYTITRLQAAAEDAIALSLKHDRDDDFRF
ncbi:MAG: hypothetical protein LBJ12_02355, partial [Oscillospiraceae bacterium]|nr:hypothetical protein [Oscillospiraceae bacterium]